jgi:dihydroorotate dehydrogenase (fumarate)
MPDLSTTYLGLKLSSPLVPSASPLSKKLDNIRRMEDAGAAAVVLYSLFEEQITAESNELDFFLTHGAESYAEALTYFPEPAEFNLGPDQYVEHVRRAKEAVSIPIIGSLNGVSTGGWIRQTAQGRWIEYAHKIEQAGADALELNIYYVPTDPELPGETIEEMYLHLAHDVKRSVQIPVAVKLSPYFTNMAAMARRLDQLRLDGLVLFNRFYQPDFDLETLDVVPRATLSDSRDLRLPLRWIAILYGRIRADLALTSGVHTPEDAIKGVMAGASVTMIAAELLLNGIGRLSEIRSSMLSWMEEHEYESIEQMRGSMSQRSIAFPAAFERAHYMRALNTWRPEMAAQIG